MGDKSPKNILIVGDRTAGWVAAYMLASAFSKLDIRVTYAALTNTVCSEGLIASVSNFAELHPLLMLLNIDLGTFFSLCEAKPFVGYKYLDSARNVDFIHSFSGYDRSYGRRVNDDLIPLLKQSVPEINYQDFSLVAQMVLQGKFFTMDSIVENPQLLNGVGVAFSDKAFAGLLKSAHKEQYFSYIECNELSVQSGADGGALIFLDNVQHQADLYIDVTGSSAQLIGQFSEKNSCNSAAVDVTYQVLDEHKKLPVIDCCYQSQGLIKRVNIGSFSQVTEFRLPHHQEVSEAFILAKPWVGKLVALGEAAGFFARVVYSEIDLVLTQARLLIEAFPQAENLIIKQQYFNGIVHQQMYWLYEFNWMLIFFNQIMQEYPKAKASAYMSDHIHERLQVFAKTGFVFTEDNEIFSELFWKSFFIGSQHLYSGGNSHMSANADALIDLLKEKVSIHREIYQMEQAGFVS